LIVVVPEVLLCLKDSNGKAREAAFQLLLAMARKNGLKSFLPVLAAGLGAETSDMRSATVTALSRVVFEFGRDDIEFQSILQSLLQTVLVLMDENCREVVKSVIGFIRVCVAVIPPDQLEVVVPDLVRSLLTFQHSKSRFRGKIKIILKKLVKLYGYDALLPHVPNEEVRLLTHMRKIDERQARRKASNRVGPAAHSPFDAMIDSDEEDSDDGKTLMTGVTGFTKLTGKQGEATQAKTSTISRVSKTTRKTQSSKYSQSAMNAEFQLPNDDSEHVIDMLDSRFAKRVTFATDTANDSDTDADDDLSIDENGRLIVPSDMTKQTSKSENQEENPNKKIRLGGKETSSTTPQGSHPRSNKRKGKDHGAAYKSKKAGGDVKKKGQKYEPYAFVPLDGKQYSRKHRRTTVEDMSSVVRGQGKRKRR
jgi:ribosomal RNA-processing protein 12